MSKLLEIQNLTVAFGSKKNYINVIEGLNLQIDKGETVGIVGESGSGKSVTSLSIMRLHPKNTTQITGNIFFEDKNLLKLNDKEMQEIRGNKIGMIFQEPMTSLNPIQTCGKQIMEALMLHIKMTKDEAKDRAIKLLELCGIPAPAQRFYEYPHQMSGGMRQRVMIAMALACSPQLLIADEPTTALDVTVQAQILELMKSLKEKTNMSIIMVTHDLGIVSDFCERVVIMYAGQIVEIAETIDIFNAPQHPYTEGLLNAIPRIDVKKPRLEAIEGMVPDIDKMPEGCRFNPRCPYAFERCKKEAPQLKEIGIGRSVRCFLSQRG